MQIERKKAETVKESALAQMQSANINFQAPDLEEEGEENETQNLEPINLSLGISKSGRSVTKEQLLKKLRAKCDEYLELEKSYVAEQQTTMGLQKDLQEERQRNIEKMHEKDQKLMLSESKREKVEMYCRKLLESGLFWRARRRAAPQGKIVMPIQGGNRRKRGGRGDM